MYDSDIQRLIYCRPACRDRRNVAKMRGAFSSLSQLKNFSQPPQLKKYFSVPTLRRRESIKKRGTAWKDWHMCQVLLLVSYSLWQKPWWKIGKEKKQLNSSPGPWGQAGRWQNLLKQNKPVTRFSNEEDVLTPLNQLIGKFCNCRIGFTWDVSEKEFSLPGTAWARRGSKKWLWPLLSSPSFPP